MSAYIKTSGLLAFVAVLVAGCSHATPKLNQPHDQFSLNNSSPIGGYVDLTQQGVGEEARFILCDYNDEQCISKRSPKRMDNTGSRRIQPIPMQLDIEH